MNQKEVVDFLLLYKENPQDALAAELFADLVQAAVKYNNFRAEWFLYDLPKKQEMDPYRTSAHNRFMDTLNIFCRYLENTAIEVPDIAGFSRKDQGDIACLLVCRIAISQR